MMGLRAAHDESRQVIRRLNHFQSGQTFCFAEYVVVSFGLRRLDAVERFVNSTVFEPVDVLECLPFEL